MAHNQEKHAAKTDESTYDCNKCDKKFISEPSLKQHMNSKHKSAESLPVGHPDRVNNRETGSQESMRFACTLCGKKFPSANEIEIHVKEHSESQNGTEGFERQTSNRPCRFFKQGFCAKGNACGFKHNEPYTNYTPACKHGPQCFFLHKNRCSFFHPGVGVQNPEGQGFRFGFRNKRPPMGVKNMGTWMNY